MRRWLTVLLCSMLPVLELRGAVPMGLSLGLPHLPVLMVSILGNLVPVPFVILFARHVFRWIRDHIAWLERAVARLEARAEKKARILQKYELFGLYLLVAVPLPGTGAWTGALVAALLNIRLKNAFPTIAAGIVTAGLIMYILSLGVGAVLTP